MTLWTQNKPGHIVSPWPKKGHVGCAVGNLMRIPTRGLTFKRREVRILRVDAGTVR